MALEALLHQNKKSSNKILPLMRIDPGKSEILLSELAWLVLLRASLNMPHLIFGHRDLFQSPQVLVLQASSERTV